MPKIVNKNYRKFLDSGEITILDKDALKRGMCNIRKNQEEGRACCIALYYSGGRPTEVLNIKAQDIFRKGSYIGIRIIGVKRGLPRTLYLNIKDDLVKELWKFSRQAFPTQYLFNHFRGNYKRLRKGKVYIEIADKLRYHIYKWFSDILPDGISPYYLRHNRFSSLAESGATLEEMRQWKGSKGYSSIMPYIHMSADLAKKVSRKIK